MRILSFSKHWEKLDYTVFTTFRFPRKDNDWYVGEAVQIYIKARSKDRERLGVAKIIGKEKRFMAIDHLRTHANVVTDKEARDDGFQSRADMKQWLVKTYGMHMVLLSQSLFRFHMNKLTLCWVKELP